MLLEQGRPGDGGRVGVLTRSKDFGRLLETILDDWHLGAGSKTEPCDVMLVERGLAAPVTARQVVWISPMPLGAEPHLEVPLCLTELYHYLEQLFFLQPRRHIRTTLNQPVDLNVRGVWLVGSMLSISDRGARVSCPGLLPKKEPLLLDFKLNDYPLRVTAEVLYDIPAGDGSGREQPQAGLLFQPLRPALRLALRRFIERVYLERACSKNGIPLTHPSVSWFDLAPNPWASLDE